MSLVDIIVTGGLVVAGLSIVGIWVTNWATEPTERIRWTLVVLVLGLGAITFAPTTPYGLSPRITGLLLAVQALLLIGAVAIGYA
ncbi:hypothetical protein [Halorussus halobius]|uniref:hypothetical protein n=1 Tax=Halorussus halobius TaxID=1710537 RepID=UPI0010923D5A|nr:hypothetical protein [Halorussus halobius]